ncbi:MAG: hypothetical protein RL088_209 [Verrucomicrobiota bacterium]|jgi:predicted site-specific integrase-resolvase
MIFTKLELAQRWKVSVRTIENYLKRGIVEYFKQGNVVRISEEAAAAAFERFTIRARGNQSPRKPR